MPASGEAPYAGGVLGALVVAAVGLLVVAVVAWAGHRMLTSPGTRSTGMRDALGNFIDVFDPAQSRADRDLQSDKNRGTVAPSPDGDEPVGVVVDLTRNLARVPRHPAIPSRG